MLIFAWGWKFLWPSSKCGGGLSSVHECSFSLLAFIYLIAISIKLCRKRQKNERKQVEERRRGVCAEVRFYTLLFVLLFSLSGCSKCEGCLSIDPGEHLSYFPMLLSHMLSCPLASSLHLSISFDIKQLESVLFVKFLFFCWKTFVVKQGSGISVCVWVCVV